MAIGNPVEMGVSTGTLPRTSVSSIAMFDYQRVQFFQKGSGGQCWSHPARQELRFFVKKLGLLVPAARSQSHPPRIHFKSFNLCVISLTKRWFLMGETFCGIRYSWLRVCQKTRMSRLPTCCDLPSLRGS